MANIAELVSADMFSGPVVKLPKLVEETLRIQGLWDDLMPSFAPPTGVTNAITEKMSSAFSVDARLLSVTGHIAKSLQPAESQLGAITASFDVLPKREAPFITAVSPVLSLQGLWDDLLPSLTQPQSLWSALSEAVTTGIAPVAASEQWASMMDGVVEALQPTGTPFSTITEGLESWPMWNSPTDALDTPDMTAPSRTVRAEPQFPTTEAAWLAVRDRAAAEPESFRGSPTRSIEGIEPDVFARAVAAYITLLYVLFVVRVALGVPQEASFIVPLLLWLLMHPGRVHDFILGTVVRSVGGGFAGST